MLFLIEPVNQVLLVVELYHAQIAFPTLSQHLETYSTFSKIISVFPEIYFIFTLERLRELAQLCQLFSTL